ncbi:FtsK/SpoIIIE domain-containing protein [Streptococcus taonis]|uniref:FtsK/SpoIIIE domain-containing protein n=1 Tax=Streptococcus taonis TaxID=3041623 RepID=A0ABT6PC32_9STRE|nr:FtsK/SpoIIIE domain-containing protein [Streptococcus sp. ST22-14]MDI1473547.1 FtsK/SpoIIIE domain-containing protein [Streptococcus sp. ST22-14]
MIRYRLNENTGHLMPSLPNFVTLLQVVGAGLLFCGFIIKWLVFKGAEVGILGSEAQLGLNLIVIGIAVLLLTNLVLLVRFVFKLSKFGSVSLYYQLRLIERQTHSALLDSATANRKLGSKFIDVSKAHADFEKSSRRITVKIKKLADQSTEDLEKFAEMLSACLVGKNRTLIVLDYWLSEDKTEFIYLLDDIVEAKARQLKPKKITELKSANDFEITVEEGLTFSMLRNIHALIVGNTSSSKTTFLKSLLTQVFMFDSEVDLTILDVKSEFSSWTFLPTGVILSDSEEILAYFEDLLELVIKREKEIAKLSARDDITGATFVNFGKEMKMKLCVIEEYSAMLSSITDNKMRRRIQDLVLSIVSRSRSSGVYMCICMQQPRSELLSTAIRDNLGVRICLSNGAITDELARMVFGEADNIDNHAVRFSGYIMTSDGQFSKPRRFWNINLHENGLEKISIFKKAFMYGIKNRKSLEQPASNP